MNEKERYTIAKRVTLVGALLNLLLGLGKMLIGYYGRSSALFADGVHSLSDLIIDGLVLIAAKMGSQKPDVEHPYGHRRIETVFTVVIAGIIVMVGSAIGYDNILPFLHHAPIPKPYGVAIIVAIAAILIKEYLFRYTQYRAKQIHSDLLEASAWHHRSDVMVSLVVLVGVVGAWFGFGYLDAIAALLVALLIIKMGVRLIFRSIRELIDTGVDPTTLADIKKCITEVSGVNSLHQLRTRSLGGAIFIDAHILVDPYLSVTEGHFIGDRVHYQLLKSSGRIKDVTVHVDGEDDELFAPSRNLPTRTELRALCNTRWQHIPAAQSIAWIKLHYLKGKLIIDVILAAGAVVDHPVIAQFRAALQDLPYIQQVNVLLQI